MENSNTDKVLLGTAEYNEAQRIKSLLAEKDIVIETMHNPSSCTSGCKVTLEVWASSADLPEISKFFQKERNNLMAGLDYNEEQINQVFDPSLDNATCPACGTEFSTTKSECPDCGLVFSIPDEEA